MTKVFERFIEEKNKEALKFMTNEMYMKCNYIIYQASISVSLHGAVNRILLDTVRTIQSDMIQKVSKTFNQEISTSRADHILKLFLNKLHLKYMSISFLPFSEILVSDQTKLIGWYVAVSFAKIYKNDKSIILDEIDKAIYDIVKHEIILKNCQDENSDNESLSEDISKIFEEDE